MNRTMKLPPTTISTKLSPTSPPFRWAKRGWHWKRGSGRQVQSLQDPGHTLAMGLGNTTILGVSYTHSSGTWIFFFFNSYSFVLSLLLGFLKLL